MSDAHTADAGAQAECDMHSVSYFLVAAFHLGLESGSGLGPGFGLRLGPGFGSALGPRFG